MAMWGGQSHHTVGTGQTLTPDPVCREAKRNYPSGTQDVGLPAPRLLAVVKNDRDISTQRTGAKLPSSPLAQIVAVPPISPPASTLSLQPSP